VLEAEEYFSPGQKGSSAMPHKRNPVLTENLTGLARMVRAYALPALENVALWHERDISHSSVERYIGPDATITLDFALARLTGVIEKLLVYPERMQKNLDSMGGLVHSQRVLLALTQAGVSREDSLRACAAQRDEGVGLVAVGFLIFAIYNWQPVELTLWQNLVLETKVPVLALLAFALGFVPLWAYHLSVKWGLNRRIKALESSLKHTALARQHEPHSAAPLFTPVDTPVDKPVKNPADAADPIAPADSAPPASTAGGAGE
jgi:hypothetical protein